MMMTRGYDPQRKALGGHLDRVDDDPVHDGELDASEKVLKLNAEGPSMAGDGKMAKYKDVIELKSDYHRVLTSHLLRDGGTWRQFMTAHCRRNK